MKDIFDGASDFNDWMDKNIILSPSDLFKKYDAIYNRLSEYRDSSRVSDNEINVIINQLDINTLKYLSADAQQEVCSRLLYFIFFWELFHDKITNEPVYHRDGFDFNEIGRMSFELLDKPLEDIFKRYVEVVDHVTFHVFDDDVDIASLKIDGMRNLLINNLYRAYHAPDRFSVVFDILDERGIHFDRFIGYENYINSIDNEHDLIDLYHSIRSRVVHYRANVGPDPNLYPNPYGGSNPSSGLNPDVKGSFSLEDLNKMKIIIMDEVHYADTSNIYDMDNPDAAAISYFWGAWKKFANDFPDASVMVVEGLMGGDAEKFFELHKSNSTFVRQLIVNYLQKLYDGVEGNPNPVISGVVLTPAIVEDIVRIMEDRTIMDDIDIYNEDHEVLAYVTGSWCMVCKKYPEISEHILKDLLGGDFDRYLVGFGCDHLDDVCHIIVAYVRKLYLNFPPPVVDVKLSDVEFNGIRRILLDESIYPKKVHYVLSDALTRLYGSWDLIEEKYPRIALSVKNGLFKGNADLFMYAYFNGDSSVEYKDIRQKIIDFILKQ